MKPSRNAVRIDFSDKVRKEFKAVIERILSFVRSRLADNQILMSFGIDQVDGVNTSYIFYQDRLDQHQVKFTRLENFTWQELENNVVGLSALREKYSLETSFTMAAGHNVPPHKHHYNPKSMWSITVFSGDSPGTIKFYQPTVPMKAGYENENLSRDMSLWECVEDIKTVPGDFYSINTWVWHGWVGSEPNLSAYASLFYIKDAATQKDAVASIERINSR